jgi:hypothetical protein
MGKWVFGIGLFLAGVFSGGVIMSGVQAATNESEALNAVERAIVSHSALGDDIDYLWGLIGDEENEGYVGELIAEALQAHETIGNNLAEFQRAVSEYELIADAGPDQDVSGSNIVEVQFDGSGSSHSHSNAHGVGIVSYQWFNQWGQLRAEVFRPTFKVNFGNNPQTGTTRSFRLVVEDTVGNRDEDWVTITLVAD